MGSILAQALSLVRVNSPHFTDRVTDTPCPHPELCPTVKTSSSVGLLSHMCADFTNTTSSLSSVFSHWAGFPSLCEHTPWDLGISASLSSEPAAGEAGDEWRASTVCAGNPEGVGEGRFCMARQTGRIHFTESTRGQTMSVRDRRGEARTVGSLSGLHSAPLTPCNRKTQT